LEFGSKKEAFLMAIFIANFEKAIAKLPEVQNALRGEVFAARVKAEKTLKEHRETGASRIEVGRGKVDYWLMLSDERGQKAAAAIEYGRAPYDVLDEDGNVVRHVEGTNGVWALHKAFGLPPVRRPRVKLP